MLCYGTFSLGFAPKRDVLLGFSIPFNFGKYVHIEEWATDLEKYLYLNF